MPVAVVAKRYAEAIFAIARDASAQDPGAWERWATDLDTVAALFSEPTIAIFLQDTNLPEARRFEILDPGLTEVSPAARDLAHLLVRKRRVAIAADLTVAYRDALNRERGIVRAAVTTAVELSDPGRQALAAALQQSSGARAIEVDASVDREILGGAIIRVGDHILDGSVRTRLRGLRRSIAGSIA